jgi:hypothetical protein
MKGLLLASTAFFAVACATATGDVSGGGAKFDATAPAFNPPNTGGPVVDEGSGTRWSDLYRDLFGPTGRANCSLEARCHGTPDSEGAKSAAGITCFDQANCYQSLRDKNMVTPADATAPENCVLLSGILRLKKADGVVIGFMPEKPATYVFSDASIERIKTWIRNGSPND